MREWKSKKRWMSAYVCVCVCVCERDWEPVFMRMIKECAKERERMCEREWERVRVSVCVWKIGSEREREREKVYECPGPSFFPPPY